MVIATGLLFVVGHAVALVAAAPIRVLICELVSVAAGGTGAALVRAWHRARLRVTLRIGRDLGRTLTRRAELPPDVN